MNEYFSNYLCHGTWKNRSITFLDCSRILDLIQADLGSSVVSPDILHYLYLLASHSKKYHSNEVPDDIVTMNSEVILQYVNTYDQTIRIVYPEDIKTPQDKSIR